MTIILYSDKNYEQHSIECIKAFSNKIDNDVRIIYYTINFKCDFKFKNLITHEYIPEREYYKLNFHKPHLCLLTTQLYKDTHYIYIDVDFFLSKKVDFKNLEHEEEYPLACYGPVEFPCIYDYIGGNVYTESILMKYFGVNQRTMRYVWNCFFTFNNKCIDFLEEWMSMCDNNFLLKKENKNYPSQDETVFNICLWKRNATKNYGHGFLNTIDYKKVVFSEEFNLKNHHFGENIDCNNYDWEYIENTDHLLGYHAFKDLTQIKELSTYLSSKHKKIKSIFIIDSYADNNLKINLLSECINSVKKLGMDILLVSHYPIPNDVSKLVNYYIFDKDNTFNEINFNTWFFYETDAYKININTIPSENIKSHEFPIIKSTKNALILSKILGYEHFIFSEFDNVYDENDLQKIKKLFYNLYKSDKEFLFFKNNDVCETIFYMGKVNFMFDLLKTYFPKSITEYNSKFTYQYPYSLELFFKKMLDDHLQNGIYIDASFINFFDNSNKKNISRVNSLRTELLLDQDNNHYLCVINLDNLNYKCVIRDMNDNIKFESNILQGCFPLFKMNENEILYADLYTDRGLYKTIKVDYNKDVFDNNKTIIFK